MKDTNLNIDNDGYHPNLFDRQKPYYKYISFVDPLSSKKNSNINERYYMLPILNELWVIEKSRLKTKLRSDSPDAFHSQEEALIDLSNNEQERRFEENQYESSNYSSTSEDYQEWEPQFFESQEVINDQITIIESVLLAVENLSLEQNNSPFFVDDPAEIT